MKVRICVAVDDTNGRWECDEDELLAKDKLHEGNASCTRIVWIEAEIPDAPEAVVGEVVG